MKNASQIINSLQTKPQFSKLLEYACIKKVESLFTPALQNMMKFAYIKNNILFFVLTHPGAKQEFDNSIDTIKSALKFYMPSECSGIVLQDIKAFVTHTPITKRKTSSHASEPHYVERAKGDFSIPFEDSKLCALAYSIQKIIKAKQ
jgi:hypothetical protein